MNLRTAGSIALISIFTLMPHAQAQDFLNLLQSYLGSGSSSITDQSQALTKTNINTRQAQLESEIAAGAASGQLTPQEDSELRTELNRIANLEGQFLTDGNYSGPEVQTMLTELSNFSVKLNAYLTNTTTTANSTFNQGWFRRYGHGRFTGSPSNQTQFQANIDTKQAQLDSAIENGTTSGRVSWNEARNLRVQLNRVANDESTFLADGKLSYSETQQLINALEKIESNLNVALASAPRHSARHHGRSINNQQSLLQARIDRGLASGKLTHKEATNLLRDERRLNNLETQLRQSGNHLSYYESRLLLSQVNQLSRKIDRELKDRQVQ